MGSKGNSRQSSAPSLLPKTARTSHRSRARNGPPAAGETPSHLGSDANETPETRAFSLLGSSLGYTYILK